MYIYAHIYVDICARAHKHKYVTCVLLDLCAHTCIRITHIDVILWVIIHFCFSIHNPHGSSSPYLISTLLLKL